MTDPAVYPAFDLYPTTIGIAPTKAGKEKSVVLSGSYAAFNLCKFRCIPHAYYRLLNAACWQILRCTLTLIYTPPGRAVRGSSSLYG